MKTLLRVLRKVLHYSPIKFNNKLFRPGRGRPPSSGFKRFRNIWLAKGDYVLVSLWAKERKTSVQAMEHLIVMQFLLCIDKNHEKEIERLTADRNILYATLSDYVKRFGKITPERRPRESVNQ